MSSVAGATLWAGVAMTPAGAAQPAGGEEHLDIRAVTDFSGMKPGDSGLLGVEIDVREGWHTYWPGISDTGYGMSLDIGAPDWITLEEPIWPTPDRYLQDGDILDHTYEGTQMVVVPFTVSEDAEPGEVAVFTVDASYLVCDEVCLPGTGEATTTLSVIGPDSEPSRSGSHGAIHVAYENRPEPFNTESDAVRVQWIDKAVAVMVRDASAMEFYPSKACSALANPIEDGQAKGNRMEIRFKNSENKVLAGRLRVRTPGGNEDFDLYLTPEG